MLAFCMSNLSVGGSRGYDSMNAWVEGDGEGYSGAEEVFGIRRSEDVMAKGRIPAVGVHRRGVIVERGMRLGNAEVVGCPVDFWGWWGWGSSTGFSGSSDADTMMWAGVVRRLYW